MAVLSLDTLSPPVAGVVFPHLLWQCRQMGTDDFLGLGDALVDFRRLVEYGALSTDSGSSIPEKYPMPQTYERIREGELGEGWTMWSAVQLDHRGDVARENRINVEGGMDLVQGALVEEPRRTVITHKLRVYLPRGSLPRVSP